MNKKETALNYNKFIKSLELLDISMESGSFLHKRDLYKKAKCKIDIQGATVHWKKLNNNNFAIKHKIGIKIKQKGRIIFQTNCLFVLLFHSPPEFTSAYYKMFIKRSNHLQAFVWPYIRQWFAEVTDRSLLPRFTTPLIKVLPKSPISK